VGAVPSVSSYLLIRLRDAILRMIQGGFN
jgi:hypothetical protein